MQICTQVAIGASTNWAVGIKYVGCDMCMYHISYNQSVCDVIMVLITDIDNRVCIRWS